MVSALAVSQAKYWHLKQVELFDNMESSDLKELGERVETELVEQGTDIYRAGDLSDRVYLLKSGTVKLWRESDDGKEFILHFMRSGDLFGELAIIEQEVRTETATVLEDAFVCSVGCHEFEDFLSRHPSVALRISRVIGERKERLEKRVLDLVAKDVRTRLAHTLARLADEFGHPDGDGISIELRLTQSDLAHLVGSTRETTSTVFNEFRRAGFVDSEGRTVRVLQPERLAGYTWDPDVKTGRAA